MRHNNRIDWETKDSETPGYTVLVHVFKIPFIERKPFTMEVTMVRGEKVTLVGKAKSPAGRIPNSIFNGEWWYLVRWSYDEMQGFCTHSAFEFTLEQRRQLKYLPIVK